MNKIIATKAKNKQKFFKILSDPEVSISDIIQHVSQYAFDPNDINYKGETALHITVQNRQINVIRWLLQFKETNVNIFNKHQFSPLMLACKYATEDNMEMVNMISQHPTADVNKINSHKDSALSILFHESDINNQQLIKFINNTKCDINIPFPNLNSNILIDLCCASNLIDILDIFDVVVNHSKLNINYCGYGNFTALMVACRNPNGEILVKKLLKHPKIDINIIAKIPEDEPNKTFDGLTAKGIAYKCNHLKQLKEIEKFEKQQTQNC